MFSANAKKDLRAARTGRWFFRLRVDFSSPPRGAEQLRSL
jgi:hypothetical protein